MAQQAKERQLATLKQNQKEATVTQIFVEREYEEIPIPVIEETNRSAKESTAKIAAALGTNRQYVSDANPMFTR